MAGHAQLKFVMTECSKTQIRLTGLILYLQIMFPFNRLNVGSQQVRGIQDDPDTINATVEILVWTDFSLYKSFQKLEPDSREIDRDILRYIATLVNAVSFYNIFWISLFLSGHEVRNISKCQ